MYGQVIFRGQKKFSLATNLQLDKQQFSVGLLFVSVSCFWNRRNCKSGKMKLKPAK